MIIDPVKARRYDVRNDDHGSTGGIWSINLDIGRSLDKRCSSDMNPLHTQLRVG